MIETSAISEHMEVIGADGVHVGTVDKLEGHRIKLSKQDSGVLVEGATGSHEGHHHYISTGLVAAIEGDRVRLSATAANAVNFTTEEEDGAGGSGGEEEVADDGQTFEAEENAGFGEEAAH